MKGHSWRCFYRIMRKKLRSGCDRGADEERLNWEIRARCKEVRESKNRG